MREITDKAIPNKMETMTARGSMARRAQVTMSSELWNGFLDKDQRKTGLSHKDREAIYLSITQQLGLKYPIGQVDITSK